MRYGSVLVESVTLMTTTKSDCLESNLPELLQLVDHCQKFAHGFDQETLRH